MPASPFKFIVDGIHGDVPNGFYPAQDSERKVILHPTPGLKELCQLPNSTEVRGAWPWNGYLYFVAQRGSQGVLWRVAPNGIYSELGYFTTSASGPVWITNNPTQLLIVDGVTGYVYTPATGYFTQITDLAFPGAAACDYQDGYGLFVKPDSNQWFFSALNDFLSFDALDFYSAESKTGNIVSLFSFMREPFILKQDSGELWYNYGGDNSTPANPTFARNTGGVMEYGCGAAKSPSTLDGVVPIWLSGAGQIVEAPGGFVKVVSNQMHDREVVGDGTIEHPGYSTFADAISFSYRDGGHVFYQLTYPSANVTWVLDATTRLLHKRQSYLDDGSGFGRHRANCYALLNNKHYVGDYSNGKIYEMSSVFYDDDGNNIQRILYLAEMDGGLKRLWFARLQLLLEMGVGLESGLDPQIMLQYSSDGGKTWSSELWRSAGKVGEYFRRAIWNRMGTGYKRLYRIIFSDAVLWRILGIDMEVH